MRGIPLTGAQIISFAEEYDALPYDTYQTIVKTLQARLAEDIQKHRSHSRFVRTGIGKYFLRRLAAKKSVFGEVRWSKLRKSRKKPEHPHRILTIPKSNASDWSFGTGWENARQLLEIGRYEYQSELEDDSVPVVCAVSLKWKDQLFAFNVGVHTHFDQFSGQRTVLLRKYLDEFDLDLFETDGTGATSATARAALPILHTGPRARLENGRLRSQEAVKFDQVSKLQFSRYATFSRTCSAVVLSSTIDLSTVYDATPRWQRRLEMNAPTWSRIFELEGSIDDEDAKAHIRRIKEDEMDF